MNHIWNTQFDFLSYKNNTEVELNLLDLFITTLQTINPTESSLVALESFLRIIIVCNRLQKNAYAEALLQWVDIELHNKTSTTHSLLE